tara:strand:- start:98128 stop:98328 length:201 start_codon:yes stop_codon:yes gene_type:complete
MSDTGVFPPLESLLLVADQAAVFDVSGIRVHFPRAGHHAFITGVAEIVDLDRPHFSFNFWHQPISP